MKPSDRPVSLARPEVKRPQGEADSVEINLSFDDNRYASLVFGHYDQNLAKLERRLGVIANANGNLVTIKGSRDACEHARLVLENLYGRVKLGQPVTLGDVDGAIQEGALQGSLFPKEAEAGRIAFEQIGTRRRGPVRARNAAQDLYLRTLKRHELVFAEGPAGTGKTWLAVGYAVLLLEQGAVERLILSRPAVEAGERLGFLPGDMRDKVDPYLRPIFDALADFMDARMLERGMQTGMIEVAPLAFMRGRTLKQRLYFAGRGPECDFGADENVPDPARRRLAHDRHRRSVADRPADRPEIGPQRSDPASLRPRRHRPCRVQGRRRRAPRPGAPHRRRL